MTEKCGILTVDMKKLFYIVLGSTFLTKLFAADFSFSSSSTGDISTTGFTFDVDEIFPTPRDLAASSDKGVDNVSNYLAGFTPFLLVLISIFAVLMLIWGGFFMVLGGANSEQTEKGKTIIKDTIMGVLFALLAYVMVITL
jgi:Type IV secretion system pilin